MNAREVVHPTREEDPELHARIDRILADMEQQDAADRNAVVDRVYEYLGAGLIVGCALELLGLMLLSAGVLR